jgi:parallel beta-helix repeat protein
VLLDADHWVVRGLEVRHYGLSSAAAGIYLRAASHCAILDNDVHTIGGKGIYLRVLSSNVRIEGNTCWDPRIGTWPWSATKSHEEEQQGISHRGGRGVVIRDNTVFGTFDGIDVAAGETDENVGADCDVEGNVVRGVSDDAIEPETIAGINVRVVRNRIDDVFSGMSVSPNYQGPTYVLYNTITNYRRSGFKFSLSGVGETWICHNTVSSRNSGTPAVHPSGPYSNIHFRNNILVGNGAASVSDDQGESVTGNDFDGDLVHSNYAALFRWKGVNYSTLAALRSATGFEVGGRSGDPRFAAAAAGDYTLGAGSPAIDGALRLPGINDRFHGAGPDIGAHELSIPGQDVIRPASIRDLRADPPSGAGASGE